MSDQQRITTNYRGRGYYDDQSASHQAVKFLTAVTIGVSLLLLSGLILTGTVIALILATPVLVVFSPILVPAAIALILAAMGFMFSGGCGVAAIATLTWLYNYVSGKHPAGSDRFDYGRMMISDKARELTQRAKEYGRDLTDRAKEYGPDRAHENRQGY